MDIMEIQRALSVQGYSPGPIDGIWGRLTMMAVRDFQTRNGLPGDGVLTDATVQKILAGAQSVSSGLVWFDEARRLMGTREVSGAGSNRAILDWATALGIPYSSDDIPWCGLFVAHCIGATLSGEPLPTNPLGARNWQKFGTSLATPGEGAVLVFWRVSRTSGLGHVGFYNGEDNDAYHVLGGNQSDSVSIARVGKDRFLEARWPRSAASLTGKIVKRKPNGDLSTNEA